MSARLGPQLVALLPFMYEIAHTCTSPVVCGDETWYHALTLEYEGKFIMHHTCTCQCRQQIIGIHKYANWLLMQTASF